MPQTKSTSSAEPRESEQTCHTAEIKRVKNTSNAPTDRKPPHPFDVIKGGTATCDGSC